MQLKVGENYYGFKLISQKEIKEVNGVGRLFIHEKSGAQLYHIENKDDNKVFSISFRTPPEDSTGVSHILEHSVLCGSRKFPIKEPFVELAKGSLNTFLNAMTFPDKTMYPIASQNEKDFLNLMDVYLDAVFYPNIYENPYILKQEGWHYEIEDVNEEIRYKGVVYNEMKGAFSSPDSVLARKTQEVLFPDSPYGMESGGDPEYIPDLTQEQFLAFHKKYYHPANSYLYIYGNGNILEYLKFIDKEYLSNFEKKEVDSEIPIQKSFDKPKEVAIEYPISRGEKEKDKTFLSLNFVIGKSTNVETYLAFDILIYLLLQTSSAPLKRALIDADLGKDVTGFFENSILQPIFSIIVKNSNPEKKEKFQTVVFETLEKLVKEGIDKKLIEAAINRYEFNLREADYGSYPKGLMYAIQMMDSWLYDADPVVHLEYEETLKKVKKALTTNYFENMIEKYLLNNHHCALILLKPKKGLAEEREKATREKLAKFKESLSKEEIKKLVQETMALRKRQMTPDSPEQLNTIPLLNIEDINPNVEKLPLEEKKEEDTDILFHPLFTNGIAYVNLYFDTNIIPQKLIPYISLLSQLLGKLSTEKYNYEDLSNEINANTGGIQFSTEAFEENGSDEQYYPKFIIKSKALVDKLPKLHSLIAEIMLHTKFSEEKRLKQIIQESKSKIERIMQNSGHLVVVRRLYSYFSPTGHYLELLNGIEYYKFLVDLEENFDNKKLEIKENLMKVSQLIFNKNQLLISITTEEKDYNKFIQKLPTLIQQLNIQNNNSVEYRFDFKAKNEGLMTSSEVQYVGKGYNFKKLGHSYTGSLQVLKTILSYDHLWNRIRVQGGAYGAFFNAGRDGNIYFVSYRDPNLIETLKAYDATSKYLKNFDVDEREMRKYIIGTISALDTPLTPAAKGELATSRYIRHIKYEDIQRERREVLNATKEDIRNTSYLIKDVLDQNYFCIMGNEDKIMSHKEIFNDLIPLFE
ncbi:insulinase family protein [Garciella nitratireducens]|uniref:insulinase family protein n=1 Tax=Garciella nitratireducens TaxID=218205 RepID=UPI000DEB0A96|nr:insulinase family protein [Garciella nitratireducens]